MGWGAGRVSTQEGIQVPSRGVNTVGEPGSAFVSRGSLASGTSAPSCATNGSFHTIAAELGGPDRGCGSHS